LGKNKANLEREKAKIIQTQKETKTIKKVKKLIRERIRRRKEWMGSKWRWYEKTNRKNKR